MNLLLPPLLLAKLMIDAHFWLAHANATQSSLRIMHQKQAGRQPVKFQRGEKTEKEKRANAPDKLMLWLVSHFESAHAFLPSTAFL